MVVVHMECQGGTMHKGDYLWREGVLSTGGTMVVVHMECQGGTMHKGGGGRGDYGCCAHGMPGRDYAQGGLSMGGGVLPTGGTMIVVYMECQGGTMHNLLALVSTNKDSCDFLLSLCCLIFPSRTHNME